MRYNTNVVKNILNKKILFLFVVGLLVPTAFSYANIDPDGSGYQYATVDSDSSQINFKCTNCGVEVISSAITGYAWSENYGWINMNPTGGGVINTSGVLSGYAWGELMGWINFSPTNGGVTISNNGFFNGDAWSQNYGWISFDCPSADSCLQTSWSNAPTSTTSGYIPPETQTDPGDTDQEIPEGENPTGEPGTEDSVSNPNTTSDPSNPGPQNPGSDPSNVPGQPNIEEPGNGEQANEEQDLFPVGSTSGTGEDESGAGVFGSFTKYQKLTVIIAIFVFCFVFYAKKVRR